MQHIIESKLFPGSHLQYNLSFAFNFGSFPGITSYEENIFLSDHMCLVAPVSTHHSLVFPTKLTSDTTAKKLMLEAFLESFSTSIILAWAAFLLWFTCALWFRKSFARCPGLLHTKLIAFQFLGITTLGPLLTNILPFLVGFMSLFNHMCL